MHDAPYTIVMYGMSPDWNPANPDPWDFFKLSPAMPFVSMPSIILSPVKTEPMPPSTLEHTSKELALMDEITHLRVEISRLQKAVRILAGEEP
jgi:hypothetical protein